MGPHTADSRTSGGSGDGVPASVVEELLSSPRRRALLDCLVDREAPVAVDDIAARLAAADADDEQAVTRAARRQARTEIYQDHLPKLTATGLVEFDSMLGTVELAGDEALSARLAAMRADSKDK